MMLAGNRNFRYVKLSNFLKSENCFKIARPDVGINDLSDTVEFFLQNVHKGCSHLIFQIGSYDVNNSCTEAVKNRVEVLFSKMTAREISLISSWPIPQYSLIQNPSLGHII